ncbi:MAG TPA: hypothetical protein VGT98_17430, partial [Candidatus Elarobacter sp.]|nr:hypothetical protein [Candidatus Elarobacter sp.]
STTPGGVALGLLDVGGAVLAFQWKGVSTLTPGTTTVGADSTTTIMTLQFPTSATDNRYVGSGGTITIATVTPTTVTGTFNATARSTDTARNIALSGTFTATVVGSTP